MRIITAIGIDEVATLYARTRLKRTGECGSKLSKLEEFRRKAFSIYVESGTLE